jgi:hypothetical protein
MSDTEFEELRAALLKKGSLAPKKEVRGAPGSLGFPGGAAAARRARRR